jgi:DNA-binding CsgD family transcriptional regulator/tetratricopeptide (TPR) repeat protein
VPVRLVERDDLLATLDGLLRAVDGGVGRVVLMPGEAGVGKTTMVDAWLQGVAGRVRLRRGTCDGSATPAPLAPILHAFPEIADLGFDHAGRSRLASRMLDCVVTDGPPTVVLIEDGHWADEATVDMLRAFAVRSSETRSLLLITFRSDEVASEHPLGILMGDWAARPGVATVPIPPFSVAAVAALAGEAGTDLDPAELHRRTGGNAFYVTEVLASDGDALPATVRDAVRARIARYSPPCRAALDVVALSGLGGDPFVIDEVLGDAAAAIDEAVRTGCLVVVAGSVRFRHDLARRTVAEDVPPMRRIAVHRAILRALQKNSDLTDPAELAHHAEAARDYPAALPAAVEAARSSSALGAHRDAVSQYERALRVSGSGDGRRVEVLDALSYELYLTGRIDDAITVRAQALQLHQERGDPAGVADAHRWLSRLNWFAARGAAAEAHGRQAVSVASSSDTGAVFAMALSNMSQLRMLAGDLDGTRFWGERAIEIARRIGADDALVHALNNIGSAQAVIEDYDSGMRLLAESLRIALRGDLQEHVARAYSNLAETAVMFRRFAEAAKWLHRGVEFCADRDLDSWLLHLEGEQALRMLYQGDLIEARTVSRTILGDGRVPAVNRVTPLVVIGLADARLGDPEADAVLAEVLATAEQSGELQRLGLVACALAELAWLRHEPPPPLLRTAYAMALTGGSPWELGELARWMARAGWLSQPASARVAEPFALEIAGRWTDAATCWAELGCRYDEALALAESKDRKLVAGALRQLTDLGASATATRLGPHLVSLGGRVPRPRRATTAAHPARLTEREAEVLRHLASGASNAEIAAALSISARTAEHHVSAVLIKLGVDHRREAVAVARGRGWVD